MPSIFALADCGTMTETSYRVFEFGEARYEGDVKRWIAKWIWGNAERTSHGSSPGSSGDDALVGDGTWAYVDVFAGILQVTDLEIAWFGVDVAYQGMRTEDGELCGRHRLRHR